MNMKKQIVLCCLIFAFLLWAHKGFYNKGFKDFGGGLGAGNWKKVENGKKSNSYFVKKFQCIELLKIILNICAKVLHNSLEFPCIIVFSGIKKLYYSILK